MRSRPPGIQWALALFVVLAVLFAPARQEQPAGPVRPADDSVKAWILAPTAREGIVATGPKVSARHLQADQRSRSEPILVTLVSVAAVLVLLALTWSARRESRAAPRFVAFRARVPRGPPALQDA